WLPAVHVESQNRLKWFHQWKPNVLTDHHEQGSNATFFFQPGVPSRVNPLTPKINQELTAKIGTYHANYLDRIGSLYFTKENYDDFYYGKGSTYPDVNGAIGILFEQASSRGHAQQTANGILHFPFTIRNQFVTTLSTLEAVKNLRVDLLAMQRDFYKTALSDAAAAPVKAYVFGDEKDRGKTATFLTMLQRHQIEVFNVNNTLRAEGVDFKKGSSYIIPANQPQHRLIRAIFEKTLTYQDSLFYDITTWTMPLAFGLPYAELNASQFNQGLLGEKYVSSDKPAVTVPKSNYAYLIEWTEFYAPAALYELQNSGIITRVATNTFEMGVSTGNKKFGYGTITIPLQMQNSSADNIHEILSRIAQKYELPVYAVTTGTVSGGSDLGSSRFLSASKPSIAMVTGSGVNPLDAGEFWHLMDQRFNIPVTHLEPAMFNRIDLNKYNTLVLVAGNYNELNKEKLKTWIQGGGNLIVMEDAVTWAAQNGISNVTFKRAKGAVDTTTALRYVDKQQVEGAQVVSGAIFQAQVDLTHPLAYGYSQPSVSLFKSNKVFMERTRNPFTTPFVYKANPLQSGWVSRQNLDAIKNAAAVVVNGVGSGKVISIADNPNFRAFWLGGSRLMMNAIFFGRMIDTNFSAAE
ncbi:MAG TPA: zinc carboxypeptidase, partial [Flavisolibacter sp.]|nr:zinc carboxypeptidase [Flavisolibacter sp.]